MGMVTWVTANFLSFCSKHFCSSVSSFLEKLITYLSCIDEKVEGATAVLKVLVVLGAILEIVVEVLEMRHLSFLMWVFLYFRSIFSLLLKIMFCRFEKIGSSSFCCRDVFMLAISVWSGTFVSIVDEGTFSFVYHGLFKVISFPLDLQSFWCYFIC